MEEQNEKKDSANRRGFVRKIIGLVAAGGIATVLLGGRMEKAQATNDQAYDNLVVDTSNLNDSAITPGIQFGAGPSGEGISSKRTAGGNQYGLDFYTWGTKHMSILQNGNVGIGTTNPLALLHVSGTTPNILMGDAVNMIYWGVIGGTISGGGQDIVDGGNQVNQNFGTVGGGFGNQANGVCSTLAGGAHNHSSGYASTVGGGYFNWATNDYSAVGGGSGNRASGTYSTVAGGASNSAGGSYSFAAGLRAKVLNTPVSHDGAFLFADSNNMDFNSVAANEFAVRCTGGARFVTAIDSSGTPTVSTVIDPSGRLGVGISSPGYLLDIRDSSGTNGLRVRTTDWYAVPYPGTIAESCVFNARGYNFATDGQTLSPGVSFGIGMAMNRPGACLQIKNPGGYSAIFEAGNVGIGTTTPTSKLHVNGRVKAQGFDIGDITYANGMKTTEEGSGLAFLNDAGEKIAVLDRQGNWHIKGDIIKDL